MRKFLALLALAVLAPLVHAQTPPTPPPMVLWTYQCCNPKVDASGNPTSAPVQGFFGYYTTNAYTGAQTLNQCGEVDFDLIALGTTTATAGGITVTYAQLAALNAQACTDQWNAKAARDSAKKPTAYWRTVPGKQLGREDFAAIAVNPGLAVDFRFER